MRMAAPARTARWRMTLQANALSSGCGAISINLERISNVGAVKVRNDTLVNRRETKTVGDLIQAVRRGTTTRRGRLLFHWVPDRSEIAIDGLRPEDHEVVSSGSLHKSVSAR